MRDTERGRERQIAPPVPKLLCVRRYAGLDARPLAMSSSREIHGPRSYLPYNFTSTAMPRTRANALLVPPSLVSSAMYERPASPR